MTPAATPSPDPNELRSTAIDIAELLSEWTWEPDELTDETADTLEKMKRLRDRMKEKVEDEY